MKTADNDAFVILPDGRKYYIAAFVMDSYETDEDNANIIARISRMVYMMDEMREARGLLVAPPISFDTRAYPAEKYSCCARNLCGNNNASPLLTIR